MEVSKFARLVWSVIPLTVVACGSSGEGEPNSDGGTQSDVGGGAASGGLGDGSGGEGPGSGAASGGDATGSGGAGQGAGGQGQGTGGDFGTGGGGPGSGGFSSTNTSLPQHWHESRGFGTSTQGGLGGEVCRVTTLNSSGSGSLRDCVSEGNRLVVFEVGGIIDLDGDGITVGDDNITIAGQTAPSPGITLLRGNFSANGDDLVVSHLAIQLGDGVSGYPDGSNIRGDNVVFDHVSAYWGMDETLSIHGVNNVTLFKSLIAEGLQFTGHEDGEHSKGSLINNDPSNLSMIGTMYAHNALRSPRVDGGEIFMGNHLVYNWGPGWDHQGSKVSSDDELENCPQCFNKVVSIRTGCDATLVNSVALQGPESLAQYFLAGHNGSGNGYVDGNIIIDPAGNSLSVVDESDINVLATPPLWPDGYQPMPTDEGFYEVLRTVGPRPGDRDAHHARVITTVAQGNGEIIDSQDEVGGYPTYPATSRAIDSIPDGAQPRQEWLDQLEDEIAVDRAIDLSRLYGLVGTAESDKLR